MVGPKTSSFTRVLSPSIRIDIESFVELFYHAALLSGSRDEVKYSLFGRFYVYQIGVRKAKAGAQHEGLAIWMLDKKTNLRYEYVADRWPSRNLYTTFQLFCQWPDSQTIIESLEKALYKMRSISARTAENITASLRASQADSNSEMFPLLPLATPRDFHDILPPSKEMDSSKLSLIDRITSTLARSMSVARTGSQSSIPQNMAEDSISGYQPESLKTEEMICRFQPKRLSFFELILLAEVVHKNAPVYGLFDNQCYMFASVIFDTIVQKYSVHCDDHPSSSTPVPAPTPEIGAPENANLFLVPTPVANDAELPILTGDSEAGRWSGLLIIDPIIKKAIVAIVTSIFEAERESYISSINGLV